MPSVTEDKSTMKVGIQLYTLKEQLAEDFDGTLKAVADVGYHAVEFPYQPPVSALALRDRIGELGLTTAGIVYPWHILSQDGQVDEAIDYMLGCGAANVVFPILPRDVRKDVPSWREAVALLQEWSDRFGEAGIPFLFHFHGNEFSQIGDSDCCGEDIIAGESNLRFQLDTFWAMVGGRDPLDFLRSHRGRVDSIHCKDMNNPEEHHDVEVGSGCVDFPAVLAEAAAQGIRWAIVEQEAFDRPQLDAVSISLRQLKALVADL